MSIDDLAKIAGVLGFAISLATFALTRWERRTHIHFGIEKGSRAISEGNESYYIDTVDFVLINLGGSAVVLDLRTLEARHGQNTLYPWRQDHWGAEESEVLVPPMGRIVLSLPHDTFEEQLKFESPPNHDQQSLYAQLAVQVRVRSTTGRKYESKGLRYWEAIGEFRRG